jgi:hypothetical protein
MLKRAVLTFLALFVVSGVTIAAISLSATCVSEATQQDTDAYKRSQEPNSRYQRVFTTMGCGIRTLGGAVVDHSNEISAAVTAIATIFIALYTFALSDSTRALRDAAEQQKLDMRESLRIAKEASDAAKLSAQAAIGVELPRLFVTKIDIELAALNLVDSESSLHKISIAITNYGRTPAFLYCESAERLPGPLPAIPIYPNAIDLEPGTIIERGELRTLTARDRDNHAHFDIRPFVAGQEALWVHGIIWFRDFLNEHHAMRFCADLRVPQGLAAGRPPKFIQGGPATYTESY